MQIIIDCQCLSCQHKFNKKYTVCLIEDLRKQINSNKCPNCKEQDNYMFQVNDIREVER